MYNQINSSNSGDNVGNGMRLFGRWIRPNLQSQLCRARPIWLFGQVLADIPTVNSPLRENLQSIRLFGQTIHVDNPSIVASSQLLPSSYLNAVHNPTSEIRTNIIGPQMGYSFVNLASESEYNGVSADQTNLASALPQEIIVIDLSSDEDEEQIDVQGDNAYVVMEDVEGLTYSNEEEFAEPDHEDVIFDEDYFHDGEVVVNLQCNHPFHHFHITDWHERMNICPNCSAVAIDH